MNTILQHLKKIKNKDILFVPIYKKYLLRCIKGNNDGDIYKSCDLVISLEEKNTVIVIFKDWWNVPRLLKRNLEEYYIK